MAVDSPSPSPSPQRSATAVHERELISNARRQADASRCPELAEGPTAETHISPGSGNKTAVASPPTLPPDALPGYELLHELHRGGQGVVYLAIQKGTKRKVAIKVMREGPFAGPADKARFEREVQILGRLRHSNIVTIHDSGVASGSYFFVMDYVSGRPLDEYCRHVVDKSKNQSAKEARSGSAETRDRLALFAKVCDAVNAAHQLGIVHRDLKPANILIDDAGEPHVLDFGLARAGDDDSRAHVITLAGQFMGSLPWASPEQAEARPERVDARSDVYSLGVMLYQVLAGAFPYPVSGGRHAITENILHADPARPSSIGKHIARDVETIVLKCLSKQPERRYSDAGRLAVDIRHFLSGEPIDARRDNVLYLLGTRGRRFLRRRPLTRRVAIVLAATLFANIIGSRIVFLWTPLNNGFERVMTTSLSPLAGNRAWQHVRVIALTDETEPEALARAEGLNGVDSNKDKKSLRRLHGRLMEKLADCGALCVVWDIHFEEESEYDEDFVRGVRDVQARGVDVVVPVKPWDLDAQGLPKASPVLLRANVRWGVSKADLSQKLWQLKFVMQRNEEQGRPSLALAAYAAALYPGAEPIALLYLDGSEVHVSYERRHPDVNAARTPVRHFTRIRLTSIEDDEQARGTVGLFLLEVPTEREAAPSVVEYRDAMTESPARLRQRFAGRVIVVGDLRRGDREDYFPHPSGQRVPACFSHATAIDALMRQYGAWLPTPNQTWLITGLAAVLGVIAAGLGRGWQGPAAGIFLLTAAWVGVSVLGYRASGFLCNPLVPVLAMLLAFAASLGERRIRPAEAI